MGLDPHRARAAAVFVRTRRRSAFLRGRHERGPPRASGILSRMARRPEESDLYAYFNILLTLLDQPSNFGAQYRAYAMGGPARYQGVSAEECAHITETDLEVVGLMRPIERRLARLSANDVAILRATFTAPDCPAMVQEWAWLTSKTGLPLGLLGLVAQRSGLTREQLAHWRKASTPEHRETAREGITKMATTGRRMRDDALAAWRAAGEAMRAEILHECALASRRAIGEAIRAVANDARHEHHEPADEGDEGDGEPAPASWAAAAE
jgi:hypothetical protein